MLNEITNLATAIRFLTLRSGSYWTQKGEEEKSIVERDLKMISFRDNELIKKVTNLFLVIMHPDQKNYERIEIPILSDEVDIILNSIIL
jgi:hypothetical protein